MSSVKLALGLVGIGAAASLAASGDEAAAIIAANPGRYGQPEWRAR